MPYGDVGGNGSVAWSFRARANEHGTGSSYNPDPPGQDKRHSAVNRGPGTNEGDRLVLSLRPRREDGGKVEALRDWLVAELTSGRAIRNGRVEIELKVELETPDQIQIRWGGDANGVQP